MARICINIYDFFIGLDAILTEAVGLTNLHFVLVQIARIFVELAGESFSCSARVTLAKIEIYGSYEPGDLLYD